jgi:hypothetical protein
MWLDMNVCFTLRVHYLDKDKARDLKCYWSPDDKKWKKTFNKRYYPMENPDGFLRIINRFKQACTDNDLIIEDDEGLEDLEEWCDNDNIITEKNIAKPSEIRQVPFTKSPIDAYRGKPQATFGKPQATFGKPQATFGKCLIVDDE